MFDSSEIANINRKLVFILDSNMTVEFKIPSSKFS